nr:hypothetical protein [Tanacetum cinerariifolium]
MVESASLHEEQVVSDHGKVTTPNGMQEENVGQCSTPIGPIDALTVGTTSNNNDIEEGFNSISNNNGISEDVFDTINTSTNVAIVSTSDTSSNNAEDGLVNVIKSDKSNSIAHVPYANLINGKQSKKAANFRTLVAPAGNGADGTTSIESLLEVKEHYEISVYGFFLGKRVAYLVFSSSKFILIRAWNLCLRMAPLIHHKWSLLAKVSKEGLKSVPIWNKLHDVPITTFAEDELSVIATKHGTH